MCRRDEYKCEGHIAKCVQRSRLCNQQTDCPLGDDETNCSYSTRCPAGFVSCRSTDSDFDCLALDQVCWTRTNCNLTDEQWNFWCKDIGTTSTVGSETIFDNQTISKLKNQANSSSPAPKPTNSYVNRTSHDSNETVSTMSTKDLTESADITFRTTTNQTTPRILMEHVNGPVQTNIVDDTTNEFRLSTKTVPSLNSDRTKLSGKNALTIKKGHVNEPNDNKVQIGRYQSKLSETTTSFTHIEHVSEGPASAFDFQPFFKPFFNSDQIPFGNFMKSGSKTNKAGDPTANSNQMGSKFDYSKFMKGASQDDQSSVSSSSGAGQATGGAPFDYSKYMKSSGSGSFDYSTYMSGKPPKPAKNDKQANDHKLYHKADYLKFYEDNSDKRDGNQSKLSSNSSIDYVPIDHRSQNVTKKSHSKVVSFSGDSAEHGPDNSTWATDQFDNDNAVDGSTLNETSASSGSVSNVDANKETHQTRPDLHIDIPKNRWPAHTNPSQIPHGKGNKVNVSKIIPKTMLNGYSYTHYGSGVFFINFGTIVNGNSNIMGSGNDVGNGNANGNNDGNTQGDNLRSNTNNRNEETDKS